MRHLDTQALRELAARDPQAVAWFREHLARPCEQCETFLMEAEGPGLLGGQVDWLLLSLAPARQPAAVDDVAVARLRRALRRPLRPWLAAAAATALAAGVATLLVPSPGSEPRPAEPWSGTKGVGTLGLELSVVARGPQGQLRRLDPGGSASEQEVVVLRYHATEAGEALLYQQRTGQPPELLGRFALSAGTHELEGPQGLLGLSLQGESGPLSLWLVAFPSGQEPAQAQVRAALANPRGDEGLELERFDLQVEGGSKGSR